MKPLISIGLPVKDGFKDRSQNDINLEKSLYFKSLKINIYFFLKQRIGK